MLHGWFCFHSWVSPPCQSLHYDKLLQLETELQAQQDQLQQHMAQFQQNNMLNTSGAPLSAQLPEGGSLNVGGIPRVPSLDLLRQLVQQQQNHGQNGSASKAPAASEALGKLPRPGAALRHKTSFWLV